MDNEELSEIKRKAISVNEKMFKIKSQGLELFGEMCMRMFLQTLLFFLMEKSFFKLLHLHD